MASYAGTGGRAPTGAAIGAGALTFGRAALSFAWLELKALRFYPMNGLLTVIQSFVSVGTWFFVSLFLKDHAAPNLVEYGGDFVAYMVVGVLFFQNATTILTLPFQSLSVAFWDKRLEVYHAQRYGIWAMLVGRFAWALAYHGVILLAVLGTAVGFAGVELSAGLPYGAAVAFYLVFVLTCFGLGLIGASNFFRLEVKRGSEPITWAIGVGARIFSGVYYPLTVLPPAIRGISACLPHTHALRGIRRVMISGLGLADPTTRGAFWVLLAFCVASLALGIRMMNRSLAAAEEGNGVGMVV